MTHYEKSAIFAITVYLTVGCVIWNISTEILDIEWAEILTSIWSVAGIFTTDYSRRIYNFLFNKNNQD